MAKRQLNVGIVSEEVWIGLDKELNKLNAALEEAGHAPVGKRDVYLGALQIGLRAIGIYASSDKSFSQSLDSSEKKFLIEEFVAKVAAELERHLFKKFGIEG
jgi:hypothetical protein